MAGFNKLKPHSNSLHLSRWTLYVTRWSIVAVFIVLWELGARYELIEPFYVSSPSRIIKLTQTWIVEGILVTNLLVTLSEAATGFILGLVSGMIFGFLLAANPTVDAILQPFIAIINALPRIAFAPLIILWFGLGFLSKVVIVISLVFFIVFFNTYRGFKEVSPILMKNARVLGATRRQIFRHIYLPSAMSWTFASVRVSVGFAIIAAIIGEYIGASAGIGYLINNAQSQFDSTGVMTGLVTLTVVVAVLDPVLKAIENYFLKWRGDNQPSGGLV